MQATAAQIATLINGEVIGDASAIVNKVVKIEEGCVNSLSFLANPKYEPYIYETEASVVIVSKSFRPKHKITATLIRVTDPYSAITQLMEWKQQQVATFTHSISTETSIHASAIIGANVHVGPFSVIGEDCKIGENAIIHPQVYIGDGCVIGENTVLHAGVKIYNGCTIGDNCIIHSNVVIGSDGFGFAPQANGHYKKVPQTGGVTIGNQVEIGANTVVDRAMMGNTIIGNGTKIDNLVQVAHNVKVGEHTVIASQAGISGSTEIGNYCQIGGQAGFVGHIKIADGVKINAQSGVSKSVVKEGMALTGSPAAPFRGYYKAQAQFMALPEMEKRLRILEQLVIKEEEI